MPSNRERAPGTHGQTLGEWSGPYSYKDRTKHRLVVEEYPEQSQVDVRHEVARENKHGDRVPADEEGVWYVREAWEIRPEGLRRGTDDPRYRASDEQREATKYGGML